MYAVVVQSYSRIVVSYKNCVRQLLGLISNEPFFVFAFSSMGGTNPNEFLNSIGKDKNGNGNGDILQWKRKAERYLVDVSI